MNLRDAERILNLSGAATPEAVRSAFRSAVLANHPDRWGVSCQPPKFQPEELKTARDVLLASIGAKVLRCEVCSNTGKVFHGFTPTPCPRGCREP